jgi:hypothetical protein
MPIRRLDWVLAWLALNRLENGHRLFAPKTSLRLKPKAVANPAKSGEIQYFLRFYCGGEILEPAFFNTYL